jgi:hypothetical protein
VVFFAVGFFVVVAILVKVRLFGIYSIEYFVVKYSVLGTTASTSTQR